MSGNFCTLNLFCPLLKMQSMKKVSCFLYFLFLILVAASRLSVSDKYELMLMCFALEKTVKKKGFIVDDSGHIC